MTPYGRFASCLILLCLLFLLAYSSLASGGCSIPRAHHPPPLLSLPSSCLPSAAIPYHGPATHPCFFVVSLLVRFFASFWDTRRLLRISSCFLPLLSLSLRDTRRLLRILSCFVLSYPVFLPALLLLPPAFLSCLGTPYGLAGSFLSSLSFFSLFFLPLFLSLPSSILWDTLRIIWVFLLYFLSSSYPSLFLWDTLRVIRISSLSSTPLPFLSFLGTPYGLPIFLLFLFFYLLLPSYKLC